MYKIYFALALSLMLVSCKSKNSVQYDSAVERALADEGYALIDYKVTKELKTDNAVVMYYTAKVMNGQKEKEVSDSAVFHIAGDGLLIEVQ